MERIFRKITDLPRILNPGFEMDSPNESIEIFYNRSFYVQYGAGHRVDLTGSVSFVWLPELRVIFNGNYSGSFQNLFVFEEDYQVLYLENGIPFGQFILLSSSTKDNQIKGMITTPIDGDKTVPSYEVYFEIPNLRYFHGKSVAKIIDHTKYSSVRARLTLESETHSITIDSKLKFGVLENKLKNDGGYILLYTGKLVPKGASISFKEASEQLRCFSCFLSFLNGRHCSPLFRRGVDGDNTLWTDYVPYRVDRYKSVNSWPVFTPIDGLSDIYNNFSKLWAEDPDNQDCLNTVIHWYVEANKNSGLVEGSIVMVQNGLELLYNWLIVDSGIIINDESTNLSAANKIRQLLVRIQKDFVVPKSLQVLAKYSATQRLDGPSAIVQMRNLIVHADKKKRKKLQSIDPFARAECLQMGLVYIELVLLHTIKFTGKYYDRCLEDENDVPWHFTRDAV